MKHFKFLALMLAMIASVSLFSSCSSDDDDEPATTSLKGTKWTVTHLGTKYIVEFTSNTDVRSYEADANNNYVNYLHEGTYSSNGNQITFSGNKLFFTDVIGLSGCYYYYFRSATVNGSSMKLKTNKGTLANVRGEA